MSDACCRLQDVEHALDYGQRALHMSTERGDKDRICRTRRLLGHIYSLKGDLQASNANYTEALAQAVSTESFDVIFICLTALAELRLREEKPEEAWRYCEMALDVHQKSSRAFLPGRIYLVCGKVMEAQAKRVGGREAQGYMKRAASSYEQAIDALKQVDCKPELAKACSLLAAVLEEVGQQDRALALWKAAYAANAGVEDARLAGDDL